MVNYNASNNNISAKNLQGQGIGLFTSSTHVVSNTDMIGNANIANNINIGSNKNMINHAESLTQRRIIYKG
jgi:hypothetical protein